MKMISEQANKTDLFHFLSTVMKVVLENQID